MTSVPTRERSRRQTAWLVAALAGVLLAYNSTAHLVPGYNVAYVPMNLVATGAVLLIGVHLGLSADEMGLARKHGRTGTLAGLTVVALAALVLVMAVTIPPLHPLLEDERIAGIGPGLVAYRTLVRIPIGTALFEEVAFRGVLLGGSLRLTSPAAAVLANSVIFGLWHVRPALDLLDANGLGSGGASRFGLVVAAIGLTSAAGYLFCILRLRSRSLLAPLLAHAGINSLAVLAAYTVTG